MSRINVANFRHPDGTDDNITLDSSGRVGVGTTSPASPLHVRSGGSGTVALFGDSAANNTLAVTRTTANPSYVALSALTNVGAILAGPALKFETTAADGTSAVERVRIDSSGRLGIGTSTPSSLLHIAGSSPALSLIPSGATNAKFIFDNSLTFSGSSGSNDRLHINFDGKVGIGTASPGALLHLSQTAGNAKLLIQRGDTASNSQDYGSILWRSSGGNANGSIGVARETGEDNGYMFFSTGSSGVLSERARITSTGDFRFNSGYGSAARAFGVRAWCNVNFTGSGSIRASGNVSSVTDRGTGRLQINLTTAMPDANYAAFGMQKPNADIVTMTGIHPNAAWSTYSTNQVSFVYANSAGGLVDPLIANMVIVR